MSQKNVERFLESIEAFNRGDLERWLQDYHPDAVVELQNVALSQAGVAAAPAGPPRPPFAVGLRILRLVDHSRHIRLPSGASVPRGLVTYVRYPALGPRPRRRAPPRAWR